MRFMGLAVVLLLLLLPASPAMGQEAGESAACTAESKVIEGEQVYLTRALGNYKIAGSYWYENKPDERPMVTLNADGSGVFEMHAKESNSGTPYRIEWWILTTCDGTPVENTPAWGKETQANHFLVVHYLDQYKDIEYQTMAYNIHKDTQLMYIVGERVKRLELK